MRNNAFTIIELLIVAVIIGILVAIAVPAFSHRGTVRCYHAAAGSQ